MASPFPHLFHALLYVEFEMTEANAPQILLRNSVTECAESLQKENASKFYNYGIRDSSASSATLKAK